MSEADVTLQIQSTEDEQRQLLLTVQVPEDRVQFAMRRAAQRAARNLQIPGFRKGKAPYDVLVRRFGEAALRSEAVEDLFPEIFEEALEEIDIVPYAQPTLDNMEMNPFVLSFRVPLEPTVTLGDYRSHRQEVQPVAIGDEAVDEALERVRQSHQVVEPVDRPAAAGDMVTLSGEGRVVDAENPMALFQEEATEMVLDEDGTFFGPDFIAEIVGLSVGESKSFDITFPADFSDEDLADKVGHFDIELLEVKAREVPELDDDLARDEGDFDTLDELRTHLHEKLEAEAQQAADQQLLEDMIDRLLEDADLIYPPALVEAELDEMVANMRSQVERSGWKWEDYLRLQQEDEAKLRGRWQEQATTRLERRLALQEFLQTELIRIDRPDVEAAIARHLERIEGDELRTALRSFYEGEAGGNMLASEIIIDKAIGRIKEILAGEAPDLEALAQALDEEE